MMPLREQTLQKIQRMPEPLIQEVSDFIDFLCLKQHYARWQMWTTRCESTELSETDMSEYLSNLEDYEERLARGEIRW